MDSCTHTLENTECARSYISMEEKYRSMFTPTNVQFMVIIMNVKFKTKIDRYNHIWSNRLGFELKMVVGMMIEIIKIDEFEFEIKDVVD